MVRTVEEAETRRQLVERGGADIIDAVTPEALTAMADNPDLTIDRSASTEVAYFVLSEAGPLATPEARQGHELCFPVRRCPQLASTAVSPERAHGAVAETVRGYNSDTFTYTTDLAKAKELFGEGRRSPKAPS